MSDNDKVKEAGAVETRCELGNSVVYPGFSKVVRDMALPAEFMLHLPVVKGAEAMTTYELKARLRVRVQEDHKLALQYTLVRPDIPADNAISDIVEHLREALTNAAVYAGLIPVTCMDKLSSL